MTNVFTVTFIPSKSLKQNIVCVYMKSSDAKASKCHLKFSSRMISFIKPVY